MIGKELIEKKPITLREVRDLLKEVKSKNAELSYEQTTTLEYATKFAKLTKAKEEKLIKELKEIPEIEEEFIIKVVDIMPDEFEILKAIAYKNSKLKEDQLKKVFEIVQKYLDKK